MNLLLLFGVVIVFSFFHQGTANQDSENHSNDEYIDIENDEETTGLKIHYQMIDDLKLRFQQSLTSKVKKDSRVAKVEVIKAQVPYFTLFEDYIAKKRPFLSLLEEKNSTDWNAINTEISLKLSEGETVMSIHSLLKNSKDQQIQALQNLPIPKVLTNNYMRKIDLKEFPRNSYPTSDFFLEWPKVQKIEKNKPTAVTQCPSNMNMVLWGSSNPVKIRLFSTNPSSIAYFRPIFPIENDKNVGKDKEIPTFLYHGFPEKVPQDIKQGQMSDFSVDMFPTYTEIELKNENGFLYVPNNYFMSLMVEDKENESTEEEEKVKTILQGCFIDASNLNQFRDSLRFESLLNKYAGFLYNSLNNPQFDSSMNKIPDQLTLATYHTLTLSDGLNKDTEEGTPSSMGTETVGSAPTRNRKNRRNNDYKEWQDRLRWNLLITSLTLPTPETPIVTDVGRTNVSVSFYSPFLPLSSDKASFGFKIQLCGFFEKEFILKNQFSYPSFTTETLNDLTIEGKRNCQEWVFIRGLKEKTVNKEGNLTQFPIYEEIDYSYLQSTGNEKILFKTNLSPLTPYSWTQLRLLLLYDVNSAQSKPSKWSLPFRTLPLVPPSPPLPSVVDRVKGSGSELVVRVGSVATGISSSVPGFLIEFTWPIDDGGTPILGFIVYYRYYSTMKEAEDVISGVRVGRNQLNPLGNWETKGAFQPVFNKLNHEIKVTSFHPEMIYEFKIAAFNKQGISALSVRSKPIKFNIPAPKTQEDNTKKPYPFYGKNHPKYLGESTEIFLKSEQDRLEENEFENQINLSLSNTAVDIKTLLHLDVNMEKIGFINSYIKGEAIVEKVIEVWRSHWSYRLITVTSSFILSDPPSADTPYSANETKYKGQIVFVKRGKIPFSEKALNAQNVGAAAIVVVDDGFCFSFTQICLPGADKSWDEGFAASDVPIHWERVRIPVVFMLRNGFLDLLTELRGSKNNSTQQEEWRLQLLEWLGPDNSIDLINPGVSNQNPFHINEPVTRIHQEL